MSCSRSPRVRLAAVVTVLLGLLVGPLPASQPAAAQDGERYDLAATILPLDAFDIEDEREGFGLIGSGPLTIERLLSVEFGGDAEREAAFEETDWLVTYLHEYWVLESADPRVPASGYFLTVNQFEDADGAEAAYDLLKADDQPVETDLDLGDASRMVEVTIPASGPIATDTQALTLVVRAEDVVAQIQIGHVATQELPDEAEFESVADALLERIEAVQAGDTPGLGTLVQLAELEGQPDRTHSYYRQLDGELILRAGESEEDAVNPTGDDTEHVYVHNQAGPNPDAAIGGDLIYSVDLYVFEDEETAASFLEEAEEFLSARGNIADVETVELDGTLGDASVALEFSGTTTSGRPNLGTVVFARLGDIVASVSLGFVESESPPPLVSIEALADGQVACLEAGECPDAIDLANVLSGDAGSDADEDASDADADQDADASDEDASESDDAGEDEDASADTDLEVYESPQYGYTVSYDAAVWAVGAEDEDPDDAYDRLRFQHELGVVTLVGDPDYRPTQLDQCVADYLTGLEQSDGVSNVEPIEDEVGEDDDRVWAAFTYELESSNGDTLAAIRYIECRVVGDVTVVVLQSSLEDDYEALSADREELLEGLEAA